MHLGTLFVQIARHLLDHSLQVTWTCLFPNCQLIDFVLDDRSDLRLALQNKYPKMPKANTPSGIPTASPTVLAVLNPLLLLQSLGSVPFELEAPPVELGTDTVTVTVSVMTVDSFPVESSSKYPPGRNA